MWLASAFILVSYGRVFLAVFGHCFWPFFITIFGAVQFSAHRQAKQHISCGAALTWPSISWLFHSTSQCIRSQHPPFWAHVCREICRLPTFASDGRVVRARMDEVGMTSTLITMTLITMYPKTYKSRVTILKDSTLLYQLNQCAYIITLLNQSKLELGILYARLRNQAKSAIRNRKKNAGSDATDWKVLRRIDSVSFGSVSGTVWKQLQIW